MFYFRHYGVIIVWIVGFPNDCRFERIAFCLFGGIREHNPSQTYRICFVIINNAWLNCNAFSFSWLLSLAMIIVLILVFVVDANFFGGRWIAIDAIVVAVGITVSFSAPPSLLRRARFRWHLAVEIQVWKWDPSLLIHQVQDRMLMIWWMMKLEVVKNCFTQSWTKKTPLQHNQLFPALILFRTKFLSEIQVCNNLNRWFIEVRFARRAEYSFIESV